MNNQKLENVFKSKGICFLDCWGKIFDESDLGLYFTENDIFMEINSVDFKSDDAFIKYVVETIDMMQEQSEKAAYNNGMRW